MTLEPIEPLDPMARLVAREEISQLKARYFRCVDGKDWAGLAEVFAVDSVLDVVEALEAMPAEIRATQTDDGGIVRGGPAIADFVRGTLEEAVTVHHGHMPEIEIQSATSAAAVWAMEDILSFPDGSPIRSLHGFGHYHETYEKIDGKGQITRSTLTRLRVDTELA
jgi:hypothetical protein